MGRRRRRRGSALADADRERERGIGLYVESTQPAAEAGKGGRGLTAARGTEGPAVSFLCSEEEEEE